MNAIAENERAVSGHNGIDSGHLTAFLERIERMDAEVKAAQEERKEVYAEVKSMGFDTAIVRKIVKLRAMDPAERHEADMMLDLYRTAAGV